MSYHYSIVSLRTLLSAAPREYPFAVLVEAQWSDKILLVLVGKNPSPDGLSIIGHEIADKAKELLVSEVQRSLQERPADMSVLEWLAQHHRWSFYISNPVMITGTMGETPEVAFGEAFKLFGAEVIKNDVVAQGLLRQFQESVQNQPLVIPIPEFAEAISGGVLAS
jgi:hypothetical protein